jgi:hypothetical protein
LNEKFITLLLHLIYLSGLKTIRTWPFCSVVVKQEFAFILGSIATKDPKQLIFTVDETFSAKIVLSRCHFLPSHSELSFTWNCFTHYFILDLVGYGIITWREAIDNWWDLNPRPCTLSLTQVTPLSQNSNEN